MPQMNGCYHEVSGSCALERTMPRSAPMKPELPSCPKCTRIDQITAFMEYVITPPAQDELERRKVIGYRCEACFHKWGREAARS
jgi:hypothetical protein